MKLCPRTLLIIVLIAMLVGTGDPEAATLPQSPTTLPSCPAINLMAISPFFDQDQTLYARSGDDLWRSTDGDATWQAVYQVPTEEHSVSTLSIAPLARDEGLHIYLDVNRYDGLSWFYSRTHSPDSGATWEELWSDAQVLCPPMTATNEEGTLFVNCMKQYPHDPSPEGVYRTADHGHAWQQVWTAEGSSQIAPSPDYANGQTVFAIRYPLSPDAGPYPMHSTDGGVTWEDLSPGLCLDNNDTNVREIVVSPDFPVDQTLFGRAYGHLLKSEDGGVSWQHLYPEDEDPCQDSSDWVWEVVLSPDYATDNTIFMSTSPAYNRSYLYVSYDGGNHWRSLLGPHAPSSLQVRRRPQDTIQVTYLPLLLHGLAAESPTIHRIYLPLASGSGALPKPMPLTLLARKYISGSGGVYYRSDNGGVSWRCLNLPTPPTGGE